MDTLALFFYMFDPVYLLIAIPAALMAMWAQAKVKSAYAMGTQYQGRCGLTGAQAAQRILDYNGIQDVAIEPVRSFLGDHYDPKRKVLRLSPDVYDGRSLSALGIAAHEVGHAIQDARSYGPLVIRNGLVPMASIGSNLSFGLILAGVFIQAFHILAIVGLIMFGAVVLFQLVNLPVEFDASRRARAVLLENGMVSVEEDRIVGKVLSAAAMTYVAATVTALLHLLYYASLVLGRRD